MRWARVSSRKPVDAGGAGRRARVGIGVLGVLGLGERADDEDLVAVDRDVGCAGEPAVGQPAGEPGRQLGGSGIGLLSSLLRHVITLLHTLRREARPPRIRGAPTSSISSSTRVPAAGPEEPAETVLAPARHDVDVEVRDALAHHVVLGHEGALGVEAVLHRDREALHLGEERPDVRRAGRSRSVSTCTRGTTSV